MLVRPHPQNAGAVGRCRPLGSSGTSRSGRARAPSRMRATPGPDFFDSLWHSAAVVGINTSALIEAAILGKSVLTPRTPEFAGTQEGTLHFRYVLFENGGFVHVGDDLDGALRPARRRARAGRRARRADARVRRTRSSARTASTVPAAPILADAIEAARAPLAGDRAAPSAGSHVARVLLTPVALEPRAWSARRPAAPRAPSEPELA